MITLVDDQKSLNEVVVIGYGRAKKNDLTGSVTAIKPDENGFIRMDDYELTPEIQEEVKKCWKAVTTDTVKEYCDIDGYWEDFYHMFGFRYEDIDYTQDVDADIEIDGVVM